MITFSTTSMIILPTYPSYVFLVGSTHLHTARKLVQINLLEVLKLAISLFLALEFLK